MRRNSLTFRSGKQNWLSVLILGFLVLAFIVGTIAVVTQSSFDLRQRAFTYPEQGTAAAPPPAKNTQSGTTRSTALTNQSGLSTGGSATAGQPANTVSGGSSSVAMSPDVNGSVTLSRIDFEKLAEGSSATVNGPHAEIVNRFGSSAINFSPRQGVEVVVAGSSNANAQSAAEAVQLAFQTVANTQVGSDTKSKTIIIHESSTVSSGGSTGPQVRADINGNINISVPGVDSSGGTSKPAGGGARNVSGEVFKQTMGILALQYAADPQTKVTSTYCPTVSGSCSALEAYGSAAKHDSQTVYADTGTARSGVGVSTTSTGAPRTVYSDFAQSAGNFVTSPQNNSSAVNQVMKGVMGATVKTTTSNTSGGSSSGPKIESVTVTPVSGSSQASKHAFSCGTGETCTTVTGCSAQKGILRSYCDPNQPETGYCCQTP
jgi:hypothetical protein